jgi:hypothetical protein
MSILYRYLAWLDEKTYLENSARSSDQRPPKDEYTVVDWFTMTITGFVMCFVKVFEVIAYFKLGKKNKKKKGVK